MGRHEDDSGNKVGTAPPEPNGHHKGEITDGNEGYSLFATVPESQEASLASPFAELAASIENEMAAAGIPLPDEFGISDIAGPTVWLGVLLRTRTNDLSEDEYPSSYARDHKVTKAKDGDVSFSIGYLNGPVVGRERELSDPLLFAAEDEVRKKGIGFSYNTDSSQYSLSLYELNPFTNGDGEESYITRILADSRRSVDAMPREEAIVASYYLAGAVQALGA